MSIYVAFSIGIVIITFVTVLLYKMSKNKSNKLIKYLPSIVFASSIALVYLKLLFISKGYDSIMDMVVIILLSIAFGVSLLVAILIDIFNRSKKRR